MEFHQRKASDSPKLMSKGFKMPSKEIRHTSTKSGQPAATYHRTDGKKKESPTRQKCSS